MFDTKIESCFASFLRSLVKNITRNAGDLGFKLGNFGDFDRVQCEDF